RLVGEHGQQPSVAWIEVEMVLVGLAQIRLLEDERHAQRALPEIDRALPCRSDEGDVVEALNLNLLHAPVLLRPFYATPGRSRDGREAGNAAARSSWPRRGAERPAEHRIGASSPRSRP